MRRSGALLACLLGLAVGYNTPPPLAGSNSGGSGVPPSPNGVCADKLDNCDLFGASSCRAPYEDWARANCAATCRFCTPPPTAPPPCKDVLSNCPSYEKSVCSDPKFEHWAKTNCRAYCRICTPEQLAFLDAHTTTISPAQCVDKVDCHLYGKRSCSGDFKPWARSNCPNYCGFCTGLPTPHKPCVDKNPDCARYDKDACTNPSYRIWAEDNCNKFCGFCGGGGQPSRPMQPTTSGPVYNTPPLPLFSQN